MYLDSVVIGEVVAFEVVVAVVERGEHGDRFRKGREKSTQVRLGHC